MAYSNGPDPGCWCCPGTYGYQYQCVEYVKRFYAEAMHFSSTGWTGDGEDYYGSGETKGLRVFDQGGTVRPKENDVICFSGMGAGHVGVIYRVGTNYVDVIDQNRSSSDATMRLTLDPTNGHYTVTTFNEAYTVQGWLRGYTSDYDHQSPSAVVDLAPGQEHQFKVWFRNTSRPNAPHWRNDGGDHSIELRSCTSGGEEAACFLRPVPGRPNWLDPTDRKRIVRMTQTDIGTDGVAEFSFWAKVPDGASTGQRWIYFRPYHNSGEWIEEWDGMSFSVNVVAAPPPPPPPPPPSFVTAVRLDVSGGTNGNGTSDLLIADLAYGNVWAAICDGYASFNPQPLQCQGMSPTGVTQYLSGDVDGGEYHRVDAIAVDRYAGNIRVAKSNGYNVTNPTIWRTNWQGGSVCQFFPGYFNANSYADVLSYYPPSGAFFVVFSNTVDAFTDAPGPYPYGAWLADWAVQPLGSEQYEIAVGDVNGDKLTDLVAFEQNPGNLYVALNNGQNTFVPQPVWLTNFCYGSTWDLYLADVTGDGKDDAVMYYEAGGVWQVARADPDNSAFTPTGGTPPYGNWITGWGTYLKTPIFGKFVGNDTKVDMALHEFVTGDIQMVRSTGSSFEYVPGSGPWGSWLQNFCTAGWDPGRMVSLRYGPDAPDTVSTPAASPTHLLLTPNPASSTLQLVFPTGGQLAGERQVWIADATGREVLSTRIPGAVASWRLDLSELATGIYFVRLANPPTDRTTQKLIVLR